MNYNHNKKLFPPYPPLSKATAEACGREVRSQIKLIGLKTSGIKKVKPGTVFKFLLQNLICFVIKSDDGAVNYVLSNDKINKIDKFESDGQYFLARSKMILINKFISSKQFWEQSKAKTIEILWEPN